MTTATATPSTATNVQPDVVTVTTPDGTFRMWSRRDLRQAAADAINEANRIIIISLK